MINRQLSRLLLCSILGSTTLISGCALVRKDSAPHQQLKPEQIKLADDIHLASSGLISDTTCPHCNVLAVLTRRGMACNPRYIWLLQK